MLEIGKHQLAGCFFNNNRPSAIGKPLVQFSAHKFYWFIRVKWLASGPIIGQRWNRLTAQIYQSKKVKSK